MMIRGWYISLVWINILIYFRTLPFLTLLSLITSKLRLLYMRIQRRHRNMSFRTEKISYTLFLARMRRDISPLQFQLIPPLVKMYPWIPLLCIFVNIHPRIPYLRTSNGAPLMMIPVTILQRTLFYTSNFEKWSLAGDIFSLTLLQSFNLLLHFLFRPVPYSFSGFISLCGTL